MNAFIIDDLYILNCHSYTFVYLTWQHVRIIYWKINMYLTYNITLLLYSLISNWFELIYSLMLPFPQHLYTVYKKKSTKLILILIVQVKLKLQPAVLSAVMIGVFNHFEFHYWWIK